MAGLRERDLAELKGNDARKMVLARLIWEKTRKYPKFCV
jgi:hypothetical protein